MIAPTFSRASSISRPKLVLAIAIGVTGLLAMGSFNTLNAQDSTAATSENDGAKEQHEKASHQNQEHENALTGETSPYLLLHAHNPVDWYPWGEEALEKARAENKPIFLSIGYSSCHWCHVMERESFLDEEIAAFLNENFVCIKVDREERPDIDSIYMTSLKIFNELTKNGRGGGWPLSMFMTPEGEPFFGGTYFPARDGERRGMPGFLTIVTRVSKAWNENRDGIKRDASRLAEITRNEMNGRRKAPAGEIKASWIQGCVEALTARFDPVHGGFGFNETDPEMPKFPEPSNLFLLLEICERNPDAIAAKNMLQSTLDQMFQGGIYDHVGGGFHRYSVDRYWHIPHFEKMLYDNGQLMSVYAAAAKMFPDRPEYRQVCDEIYSFLKREMTAEEGGFYSALDAESEGVEGKFYRWEKDELKKLLGDEDFEFYASVYRINEAPNFEDKYYAPQLTQSLKAIAGEANLPIADLQAKLAGLNRKLLDSRQTRPRPLLDNKILTGWNGLMISGLADAGRILEKPEYIELAKNSATFVWKNSLIDGRLRRTFTAGEARLNGYLDDYAFLIDGYLSLHKATGDKIWLDRADQLQKKQNELFWDKEIGGFYFTSSDHESLLTRSRNPSDGALPSGNSVSIGNLVALAKTLDKTEYREMAEKSLKGSSSLLTDIPSIAPRLLIPAYEFLK